MVAPHVVYFDIETRISPSEVGWAQARKGGAGISAIVIYDAHEKWVYCYDSHSIDDAIHHLEVADITVSWNGADFDIPAMEGYAKRKIKLKHHLDLYAHFYRGMGNKRKKGSGMGPTAERTIGISKTGHGADAPHLSETGQFGALFNYCAQDVYVLKSLTKHILDHAYLIDPDGQRVIITVPPEMKAFPNDVL